MAISIHTHLSFRAMQTDRCLVVRSNTGETVSFTKVYVTRLDNVKLNSIISAGLHDQVDNVKLNSIILQIYMTRLDNVALNSTILACLYVIVQ